MGTKPQATLKILLGADGVQGVEVTGPLAGHLEALRISEAILPALALVDALLQDRRAAAKRGAGRKVRAGAAGATSSASDAKGARG
jgi:hypothetical protein